MKTLRVCLYRDLPAAIDRDPDYLYFAYDMLYLYSGQNYLEDNFAIVEEMPEDPVYGMMYIFSSDGSVHRIVDYTDTTIAEIEDDSQIEILAKAGTMFYVNAQHKYLDSQRRVITIPYTDGTYELNVSVQKESIYDENTILKYNPDSGQFEIYGDTDEDFIDYSQPFRGATTKSATVNVSSSRISASVNLSTTEDNALRVTTDGLYVKALNSVSRSEFNEWATNVADLKAKCEDIINNITTEFTELEGLISPEYIESVLYEQLESKFGDIQTAIDNYDAYVAELDSLENNIMNYVTNNIINLRYDILQKIEDYQTVLDLDDYIDRYKHEVNYYDKAEEFFNSNTLRRTKILISAGLAAYFEEFGEEEDL